MAMKFNRLFFLLTCIICFGIFLRFWNFPERYGIGYDGSRDAIVSYESKSQLQLPLTGSFSSIGPITFGPWYYWYIAISNFVIPSFWAPWISVSFTSLLMIYTMFVIGKNLIDGKLGLILALITAISPAQIIASVNLQQHALIGFLSSLAIYFFLRLLKINSGKISFLFGFIIGLAVNIHYQAAGLFLLAVILLIYKRNFFLTLYFLSGLLLSLLPILVFELNNHWFNTKNIVDYILYGQYRIWTPNRWLTFAFKFFPEFWSYATGFPYFISFSVMLFIPLLLTFKLIRLRLNKSFILLSLHFAILVVILRYYRGEKFFGYLQFFHPYLFIYTGLFFYFIIRKVNHIIFAFLISFLFLIITYKSVNAIEKTSLLNRESSLRISYLIKNNPDLKYQPYECGLAYDRDRIQALLLMLYQNRLFDEKGVPVTVYNPACPQVLGKKLKGDLIVISPLERPESMDLKPLTTKGIFTEVARWWFKEQP